MNGWTPSIPLKTRLENLMAQIPQEYRNQAAAECLCDNPHDFERDLTSYVVAKKWLLESVEQAHPVETAYQLEKAMDEDYPMVFYGGEVGEFIPYRPATSDGDLPF